MLTRVEIEGLGTALNEATLVGIEVDVQRRRAAITVAVLALPEGEAPPAEDRRVQLLLEPVGRVAASLRMGLWNDETALVQPLELEQIQPLIHEMSTEIYGWEFIDRPEADFESWSNRLSLDVDLGEDGRTHSLTLFQEAIREPIRHFDIRIWFDNLAIRDPSGRFLPL